MNQNRYNLPELDFIGGEEQNLIFHLFDKSNDTVDIGNITCCLSISYYGFFGNAILIKQGQIIKDMNNPYLKVHLAPSDTVNLHGKFMYQISLKDTSGKTELFQGLMLIYNNNHKDFVTK